ncbi:hypothetical protein IF2G_07823 [Cordyceps javanica]|nr:hypothetical protein IF2G_07823 [Cordyceps javanica]
MCVHVVLVVAVPPRAHADATSKNTQIWLPWTQSRTGPRDGWSWSIDLIGARMAVLQLVYEGGPVAVVFSSEGLDSLPRGCDFVLTMLFFITLTMIS